MKSCVALTMEKFKQKSLLPKKEAASPRSMLLIRLQEKAALVTISLESLGMMEHRIVSSAWPKKPRYHVATVLSNVWHISLVHIASVHVATVLRNRGLAD